MTAVLFVLGVVVLAAAVVLSVRRYLSASAVGLVLLAMPLWLLYVGLLSWSGVVADTGLRPPGVFFILRRRSSAGARGAEHSCFDAIPDATA